MSRTVAAVALVLGACSNPDPAPGDTAETTGSATADVAAEVSGADATPDPPPSEPDPDLPAPAPDPDLAVETDGTGPGADVEETETGPSLDAADEVAADAAPETADGSDACADSAPGCGVPPLSIELDLTPGMIVKGNFNFTSKVSGGCGDVTVTIFVDGVVVKVDFVPPYSTQLPTGEWPDGSHVIAVQAVDDCGCTAGDAETIVFENPGPEITITSPEGGCAFCEDGGLLVTAKVSADTEFVQVDVNWFSVAELVGKFLVGNEIEIFVPWDALIPCSAAALGTVIVAVFAMDDLGMTASKQLMVSLLERLLWAHDTTGEIWGKAAQLADGNVAVATLGGKVLALTPGGSEVWSHPVGSPISGGVLYDPGSDELIFETLAGDDYGFASDGTLDWKLALGAVAGLSGGVLYVWAASDTLLAVDPANGSNLWTFTLPAEGTMAPIASADGTVLLGAEDEVLRAVKDGEPVWQLETPGHVATAGVAGDAGSTYFVAAEDGLLLALDAATGAVVWTTLLGGAAYGLLAGTDGALYVSSAPDSLTKFAQADGSTMWTHLGASLGATGALAEEDDLLLGGTVTGTIVARHRLTGTVAWTWNTPDSGLPNTFHSAPIVDGTHGVLYVGGTNGNVHAVRTRCP